MAFPSRAFLLAAVRRGNPGEGDDDIEKDRERPRRGGTERQREPGTDTGDAHARINPSAGDPPTAAAELRPPGHRETETQALGRQPPVDSL